ncbi:MAG: hypothetical protein ACJ8EY_01910, partial [Sphingomicrobium sp.]
MRNFVLLASLMIVPGTALAQSMNAETFYKRATALQEKGPLALLSSDEIKALVSEAEAAGKRADEKRLAAIKAGKPPRYCPPEGPRTMGSDEFMKGLSSISQAQRARINMTEATTRIVARKYP